MKPDREIVESSSHASGYNLVSHSVSFSREGRLHCEVVCMFPTNKVLTQSVRFSSPRFGYFCARLYWTGLRSPGERC